MSKNEHKTVFIRFINNLTRIRHRAAFSDHEKHVRVANSEDSLYVIEFTKKDLQYINEAICFYANNFYHNVNVESKTSLERTRLKVESTLNKT